MQKSKKWNLADRRCIFNILMALFIGYKGVMAAGLAFMPFGVMALGLGRMPNGMLRDETTAEYWYIYVIAGIIWLPLYLLFCKWILKGWVKYCI